MARGIENGAEAGDASSQYELAYLLRDQRVKLRSEQQEVGREKRRMALAATITSHHIMNA